MAAADISNYIPQFISQFVVQILIAFLLPNMRKLHRPANIARGVRVRSRHRPLCGINGIIYVHQLRIQCFAGYRRLALMISWQYFQALSDVIPMMPSGGFSWPARTGTNNRSLGAYATEKHWASRAVLVTVHMYI